MVEVVTIFAIAASVTLIGVGLYVRHHYAVLTIKSVDKFVERLEFIYSDQSEAFFTEESWNNLVSKWGPGFDSLKESTAMPLQHLQHRCEIYGLDHAPLRQLEDAWNEVWTSRAGDGRRVVSAAKREIDMGIKNAAIDVLRRLKIRAENARVFD